MENFTEPELIKAGDMRLKLGHGSVPPLVDCRVIAEQGYQKLYKMATQKDELLKAVKGAMAIVDLWKAPPACKPEHLDEAVALTAMKNSFIEAIKNSQ